MVDDELQNEIDSIRAIYSDDVVIERHNDGTTLVTASVTIDRHQEAHVIVTLPRNYPTATGPTYDIEGLPRGLRELVTAKLDAVIRANRGSPCVFALVEAVREHASHAPPDEVSDTSLHTPVTPVAVIKPAPAAARGISIVHSAPTIVSRSTFVAHVAAVSCRDDVDAVLEELLCDPRISRATHNMFAYRFRLPTGGLASDNDDDGEAAAGGRLAHLLEAMSVEGVLVVVSRWYGGVLMGPLRFKIIADCARAAIESAPWFRGRA